MDDTSPLARRTTIGAADARFPGASRRARRGRAAGAHRPSDQQGHRAAPAGALAVRRRRSPRTSAAPSSSPTSSMRSGRRYDIPVAVGALAGLAADLRARHGPRGRGDRPRLARCDRPSDPAGAWSTARALPGGGHHGRAICARPDGGLKRLPVPVSTPGFDAAPYLTATMCITKDPETGVAQHGHLSRRAQGDRPARRAHGGAASGGAGGYLHWLKYRDAQGADADRHRARLRPGRGLHRAAEARGRSGRDRRSPARSPAGRSRWSRRRPSISRCPPTPRSSSRA